MSRAEEVEELNKFCWHGYEVSVIEGRHVSINGENYVELTHGTKYTLHVKNGNNHACRFQLKIDENSQGTWKINAMENMTTDRAAHDRSKIIFFRTSYAPQAAEIQKGDDKNGLIECTFLPAKGADEIQFEVNAPVFAEFGKTKTVSLFPSCGVRELFEAAIEQFSSDMTAADNSVIVIWRSQGSSHEVIDKNDTRNLRDIVNEAAWLSISLLPQKARIVGGREPLVLSRNPLKMCHIYAALGKQKRQYIFVLVGNSTRRICDVKSLECDFRNVWGVLTKEEIVDMFSDTKRDNIAGCVKFIVSDNKELQLEQADNAGSSAGDISEVAETGGERMSLYKAGATARYQEVSKYVFRDVATIETDQSKKVNINFRLVGRIDDQYKIEYDEKSVKPMKGRSSQAGRCVCD